MRPRGELVSAAAAGGAGAARGEMGVTTDVIVGGVRVL